MVLNPNSDGADEQGLKSLLIPRGTLVHVAGLPFLTTADAPVSGRAGNMALREKWSDAARAAAAAARKAKYTGANWSAAARRAYKDKAWGLGGAFTRAVHKQRGTYRVRSRKA